MDVFRTLALLLSSMVNLDALSPPTQSGGANTISSTVTINASKDPQPELEFIAKMVQMLNQILMTTR
jgi:hypothetical protein